MVRVLDRGPGMPAGVPAQGDAPRCAGQGLGIGLLLACSAAERCGGSIGFAPRDGGGTVVTLSLPLASLQP